MRINLFIEIDAKYRVSTGSKKTRGTRINMFLEIYARYRVSTNAKRLQT